jgi:hypothetical protein
VDPPGGVRPDGAEAAAPLAFDHEASRRREPGEMVDKFLRSVRPLYSNK